MSFSYCVTICLYLLNQLCQPLGRWIYGGRGSVSIVNPENDSLKVLGIMSVDSEGYSSDAESNDSVDQDTHPPLWLNTVILQ